MSDGSAQPGRCRSRAPACDSIAWKSRRSRGSRLPAVPEESEVVDDVHLVVLAHRPVGEVVLNKHRAGGVTNLERAVSTGQALPLPVRVLGVEAEVRVQRPVRQWASGPVELVDAQTV